jgi:hypothetical protein
VHDKTLAEELRHLPRLLTWDKARALEALRKQVLYLDNLVDTADRLFQARQVRETLATALALHRKKR